MRILVVEDDFTSRKLLQILLSPFGDCDIAVNGREAVSAFELAWQENQPYQLICLDIMMLEMDGQEALREIRRKEQELGIRQEEEAKVLMTTALDSPRDVFQAFYRGGCTAYLTKPINKQSLLNELKAFGLVDDNKCCP